LTLHIVYSLKYQWLTPLCAKLTQLIMEPFVRKAIETAPL
jgi:hypothetical protein